MSDIQRLYSSSSEASAQVSDRLEYVADLIAELETLTSAEPGCDTLRGLLVLAEREARRAARIAVA